MKCPSSLLAKILTWFFLNLLLLTLVLGIFFAAQPQMNLHAFFGQQGSDRLRSAGMLIAHDLSRSPADEWTTVLSRHAEIHGVDFMLVLRDGLVFSPVEETLPEEVVEQAKDLLRRRGGQQNGQEHRWNPHLVDCLLLEPDCEEVQPVFQEFSGRKNLLVLRTKDPSTYWFGLRVPLFLPTGERRLHVLLLARSHSITGNGFFFDPLPWMVVAAAVILISLLFWLPLIRNITKPLLRMTLAAEEIARGNFAVSIQERRSDEIGRLATTINHMTARLSAFVKGQKRFLGDVSHELGSPVARIQFGLGILEQRVDPAHRERVRDVMEDVDHMSRLIGELLAFSRAEMNAQAVELGRISLLPVVQTAVKRECPPPFPVQVDIAPELEVLASAELLTRALANLLRNAIKYAGEAGPLTVRAEEKNQRVELVVRDYGPGVPEEYLDRLFEPFFRLEPSRDRDSGGVGLGLAIVKTCVESCGGRVAAGNVLPQGFQVTLFLNSPNL
jgi:two-component system sensor histidine kinase CpxA